MAVKLWKKWWAGQWCVEIRSDNMNTCSVIMNGKSIDPYMQAGAKELYMIIAANYIDLKMLHTPGL